MQNILKVLVGSQYSKGMAPVSIFEQHNILDVVRKVLQKVRQHSNISHVKKLSWLKLHAEKLTGIDWFQCFSTGLLSHYKIYMFCGNSIKVKWKSECSTYILFNYILDVVQCIWSLFMFRNVTLNFGRHFSNNLKKSVLTFKKNIKGRCNFQQLFCPIHFTKWKWGRWITLRQSIYQSIGLSLIFDFVSRKRVLLHTTHFGLDMEQFYCKKSHGQVRVNFSGWLSKHHFYGAALSL